MTWGRNELEALGRDDLLAHARKLSVARPELMTRLELIEELLRMSSTDDADRRLARGLLGKARDLVARVMDLGLHLPDAAQRVRPPASPSSEQAAPAPLATTALAGVYAAQGHRDQALAVLDQVLEREPSHAEALRLRSTLADAPEPQTEPSEQAPAPRAPAGPPSRDELIAELHDGLLRLSWRVKPSSFARRRARTPDAKLVLRVVQVRASTPEPEVLTVDTTVDSFAGARTIPVEGSRDQLCAAIGMRSSDRFDVIASAL